jgi:ABC-type multidrug transport system permease subunit
MCAGRLVYAGSTAEAVGYFTRPQLGYKYTQGQNPAEFIIAVGGGSQLPEGSAVPRHADELEALFRSSKFYTPINIGNLRKGAESYNTSSVNAGKPKAEFTSPLTQFRMLVSRTWLAKVRDTPDLKAQFIKNFVVGLLVGIVFYGQGDATSPLYTNGQPNAEVSNCSSILFFTMMYTMVGNLQAIPYLSSNIIIYHRELASNAYFPAPYWLSQLITTLPIQFGYHFLFIILSYFLVQLPANGSYFFFYLILLFFANTTSYYSAMWLAAATMNEQLAFALYPVMFLFLSQFAGYSITINSIPPGWSWAPYLSYARWVFEGLMVNQWEQFDTDDAPDDQLEDGNGNVLAIYDFTSKLLLPFLLSFFLFPFPRLFCRKFLLDC